MGLFITFEGPDGSGKSTQARLLAAELRRRGVEVVETREPGGTPLGERLRSLILDPTAPAASPLPMAMMYAAARAQLTEEIIKPALSSGQTVIADRYADSTMAYQGYGLGVSAEHIAALREMATAGCRPDITVFVDIDPETGARRTIARGSRDRLDARDLEFHRRVRAGYQRMIAEDHERWVSVCGDGPPDAVAARILAEVLPRLAEP